MHLPFGPHHLIFGVRRLAAAFEVTPQSQPCHSERSEDLRPIARFWCDESPFALSCILSLRESAPFAATFHPDRSNRAFSPAPPLGVLGCGTEGSWQRVNAFSSQSNRLHPACYSCAVPLKCSSLLPVSMYDISYYDIFPGPGPLVLPSTCPAGPTREITVS